MFVLDFCQGRNRLALSVQTARIERGLELSPEELYGIMNRMSCVEHFSSSSAAAASSHQETHFGVFFYKVSWQGNSEAKLMH